MEALLGAPNTAGCCSVDTHRALARHLLKLLGDATRVEHPAWDVTLIW